MILISEKNVIQWVHVHKIYYLSSITAKPLSRRTVGTSSHKEMLKEYLADK